MVDYYKYMRSSVWVAKSKRWINETGFCEKCGNVEKTTVRGSLTCHHKNYDNLGNETRKDVMVLCWWCHQFKHKKFDGLHRCHSENRVKMLERQEKDKRWVTISKTLNLKSQ